IYDYLRLLYARIGRPVCPIHGIEISSQTVQQMVDQVLTLPERSRIQILAPVVSGRKGEHVQVFEQLQKEGFVRVRVHGEMYEVTDEIDLYTHKTHLIEVIVDRLFVRDRIESRLSDSIEKALRLVNDRVSIDVNDGEVMMISDNHACWHDLRSSSFPLRR